MTTLTTYTTKTTALTKAEADANFDINATAKTALYTVAEADNRDVIECSGTFTVTLPVAATIAAAADTGDFEVTIKNSGTGIITVARSSTDTIDGATSIDLHADQSQRYKVNQAQDGYNIVSQYGTFISGSTNVATGTSVEIFTSIPAWAKKITLSINVLEVSSASTGIELEIGDSTAYLTAGYVSDVQTVTTTNTTATSVGGMAITDVVNLSTTDAHGGHMMLTNQPGSNLWMMDSFVTRIGGNVSFLGYSAAALTSALTRMRMTSGGFDGAGVVSYLIEG